MLERIFLDIAGHHRNYSRRRSRPVGRRSAVCEDVGWRPQVLVDGISAGRKALEIGSAGCGGVEGGNPLTLGYGCGCAAFCLCRRRRRIEMLGKQLWSTVAKTAGEPGAQSSARTDRRARNRSEYRRNESGSLVRD